MDRSIGCADTELYMFAAPHGRSQSKRGSRVRIEEPLLTEELTDGVRRAVTLGDGEWGFSGTATPRKASGFFTKVSQTPLSSFYVRHPKHRRAVLSPFCFSEVFSDAHLTERLVGFLELADTVKVGRVCKAFTKKEVRKVLRKRRRQLVLDGLKPKTRSRLWRWVADQSLPRSGVYSTLKARVSPTQVSILADIRRIDSDLTENQQIAMLRILSALAFYLPDVGYCQSLVFVAAVLVQSSLTEEECFWVLHSLLVNYDFSAVVAGGFEKLKLLCFQFDCFLNAKLRPVADKLKQADFSADLYALRWLLTLFSYELPQIHLCTLWDLFFIEKWKVMIRAGLAFVQTVHTSRNQLGGSELFCLLRGVNADEDIAQQVLRTMYTFKVTQRMLDNLLGFYLEDMPPSLQLVRENGRERWVRKDEECSEWAKTQVLLDETLCLEDLTSPGGPLNVYCQCKPEPDSRDETILVCANCGSSSHSSMYCDQDTEDTSLSSFR